MYNKDRFHAPAAHLRRRSTIQPGHGQKSIAVYFWKNKTWKYTNQVNCYFTQAASIGQEKKKKVGELTWHIVFFWKKRENISMSLTVLYMGQKYWSKQGKNSNGFVRHSPDHGRSNARKTGTTPRPETNTPRQSIRTANNPETTRRFVNWCPFFYVGRTGVVRHRWLKISKIEKSVSIDHTRNCIQT